MLKCIILSFRIINSIWKLKIQLFKNISSRIIIKSLNECMKLWYATQTYIKSIRESAKVRDRVNHS